MTNFHRIRQYYQKYNEWNRLDTPPGQLELKIVLEIIEKHIKRNSNIFDLGGGAGRYSYELALKGYQIHLADLSPDLIEVAREKLSNFDGEDNIKSIEIANAIDLSNTSDETYDNVLLFGPLYHLTDYEEICKCLKEVYRILKPDGRILASYIPYHCGLSSILERSFHSPEQVGNRTFFKVFREGVFNNKSNFGFQEGNFIRTSTLLDILDNTGFKKVLLRSIRGIGYKQESEILALQKENPGFYQEIMKIIHLTADNEPIIETCGHAILIGEKVPKKDYDVYAP